MVMIPRIGNMSATVAHEALKRQSFDAAIRKGTIEALVRFLEGRPATLLVDEAVDRICILLAAEFPSHRYVASMPRVRLKRELLGAIRGRRPAVIAFASKQVRYREVWTWTTHFVELAGTAARIERMVPTIHTPQQGVFRAPGGNLNQPLEIEPFGRATHQWSCWAGPWRDSTVALNYFGAAADDDRVFPIHCLARYPG